MISTEGGSALSPYGEKRIWLYRLAVLAAEWLRQCLRSEDDRLFLWAPVFIGIGVATYFSLPFEPHWGWAVGFLTASSALVWQSIRRPTIFLSAVAFLLLSLGFSAAVMRAHIVSAPVLPRATSGEIVGEVLSVEGTEKGGLVAIISPSAFAGLADVAVPGRVRVQIRLREAHLRTGAIVSFRARLMPPPEPVHPRGFDFARFAWFEGIGAVGFAYTLPEEISPPGMNAATLLANLRISIGDRIRGVIGGVSGSVAAALVNGERASIPDSVSDELRASGIYHVLSISGLHMVLFGGSLFWISRVFFVLIPGLALRYPIRKWAAAVALVGATFYLLISGAEVATQRAWIMIALMFVAMLLDRPALSMRNVMLAAVLILLWRPESLLGASFQMSFAAVIALIAFYESKTVKRWVFPSQRGSGFLIAAPRWLFAYALGTALTSIVAGTATGVIAAYHFNRIAVYGLAGNMAIMPFVGILVMPMALLSLVLMPFGLEAPALWIMEIGIDGMLAVAHEVASWQGADRLIREAPFHALMLAIGGGLWLVIWREKWRYLGLLPIILGLMLWDTVPRYDVLVDRDAALFAVRNAEGQLALTAARPAYAAENWLRMEGDRRKPREAASSEMLRCDVAGCAYQEAGKKVIAIPMTLDAVAEDCAIANIVIAKVPVPRSMRKECGADLLLDYFYFWRNGATGITLQDDGGISIETARDVRGNRPWVQRSPDR